MSRKSISASTAKMGYVGAHLKPNLNLSGFMELLDRLMIDCSSLAVELSFFAGEKFSIYTCVIMIECLLNLLLVF